MDNELQALLDQLKEKEAQGSALDINGPYRKELMGEVLAYTNGFLDTLEERKAYESKGYDRTEADHGFNVKEAGTGIGEVLDFIGNRVDHTGLNPASGGHLGYIPGGGIPASALGDYLAAITNRYAGNFYASPGAVRMENAMVHWTGKLVGYGKGFGGNLTSGGSIANLIAITTARTAKRLKGKDLDRNVVYMTSHGHHSLAKGLNIACLGECITREIALDSNYRMDVAALGQQVAMDVQQGLKPFLLIANAGSTDTGAVDPIAAMADVAGAHDMWFHVDAAYGGFFLLTEEGRARLAGIERADSVVLDPHKGLFLPYGIGIVLVKHIDHLLKANSYEANYMQDAKEQELEHSPAELSPELSKHFRGLRMWLPLKLHGIAPFRACLEEKLLLARYFRYQAKALGFEVGPEPDLSVVIFRYVPPQGDADAFNRALAHAIQQDGRVFISTTVLDGVFVLRFAVLSFRTHRKETDVLLEQMREFVRKN